MQINLLIGSIFALFFLLIMWFTYSLGKIELRQMEDRMTKNMIEYIKKSKSGEKNG